jgi:hypothetical protein
MDKPLYTIIYTIIYHWMTILYTIICHYIYHYTYHYIYQYISLYATIYTYHYIYAIIYTIIVYQMAMESFSVLRNFLGSNAQAMSKSGASFSRWPVALEARNQRREFLMKPPFKRDYPQYVYIYIIKMN